ncbi:MAG: hypothetical protein R3C05_08225 [Pirellulaceae bacterium]
MKASAVDGLPTGAVLLMDDGVYRRVAGASDGVAAIVPHVAASPK